MMHVLAYNVDKVLKSGCSFTKNVNCQWMTLNSHNDSAKQLKNNHKAFVTVRKKHSWQGMEGTRLDIIAQWKKAYESARKENHEQRNTEN